MTLEQIRAMDDLDLELHVTALLKGRSGDYTHDLNAAMSLVPQGDDAGEFLDYLYIVCYEQDKESSQISADFIWLSRHPNKPRALCEAFILWKGSAT